MQYKQLRDLVFPLHRYLGLVVGIIAIVIGLTGSLLVFYHEMDHALIRLHTGPIVPQGNPVSLESALNTVWAAYADRPELTVVNIEPKLEPKPGQPYTVGLTSSKDEGFWLNVFVNPYTGSILFSREWGTSLFGIVFRLHYELLAGKVGLYIAGIAALIMVILSITGLILWPGWRKLSTGFKVKLQGHIKRINFDIHKVVGIVAIVFLAMTSFTGFLWNFWDYTEPALYTATLTPKPPDPVSKPIAGKSPLTVDEIVQKAVTALPGAVTTAIDIPGPDAKDGVFAVYRKFPQDIGEYDNSVYLDQYSGEVLKIHKNSEPTSLTEGFINSFGPIHFGTFGGLPTRIFYVFIGLTPFILSVTGYVMWQHRYRGKAQIKRDRTYLSGKGASTPRQAGSRNL